ncbi:hypothetical protein HY629_02530 [Candidatus Uhrbacteria bacterium]|nr:hypothetical protein [Candidatus Uhrbacteria bacterium]
MRLLSVIIFSVVLTVVLSGVFVVPDVAAQGDAEFRDPLAGSAPSTGGSDDAAIADTTVALIARIIRRAFQLVGTLAFLMFLWGGFLYLTAGGQAERADQGKRTLVWAAAGTAVIAASYGIAVYLVSVVGGSLGIAPVAGPLGGSGGAGGEGGSGDRGKQQACCIYLQADRTPCGVTVPWPATPSDVRTICEDNRPTGAQVRAPLQRGPCAADLGPCAGAAVGGADHVLAGAGQTAADGAQTGTSEGCCCTSIAFNAPAQEMTPTPIRYTGDVQQQCERTFLQHAIVSVIGYAGPCTTSPCAPQGSGRTQPPPSSPRTSSLPSNVRISGCCVPPTYGFDELKIGSYVDRVGFVSPFGRCVSGVQVGNNPPECPQGGTFVQAPGSTNPCQGIRECELLQGQPPKPPGCCYWNTGGAERECAYTISEHYCRTLKEGDDFTADRCCERCTLSGKVKDAILCPR